MTNDKLATLLKNKQVDFQSSHQQFDRELKLSLFDPATGEVEVLIMRPDALAIPDELLLDYTYEVQCDA
jgi:hypothetical protein